VAAHPQQQHQGSPAERPRWFPYVAKAVDLALWPLPFARRWIAGTVSNRYGRIGKLREEGKLREAYDLAVRTIPHCLGTSGWRANANRLFFWLLLTHAAELVDTFEHQQQVLEFLPLAPGPGGAQEATVLEEISRWPWRRGEAAEAVKLARAAVKADPKWPWAHLTLAFYLHESKLGDPVPVLAEAVRADPACRPEIEKRFGAKMAAAVRKG
jgi:hypothetical protein